MSHFHPTSDKNGYVKFLIGFHFVDSKVGTR